MNIASIAFEYNFKTYWLPAILLALAWVVFCVGSVWLLTRVSYKLSRTRLWITILGIPVRSVRLDNIQGISTRPVRFAEKWNNMLFVRVDRVLVIHKKRGLFKRIVITPEQRYVFKNEIDRAIKNLLGQDAGLVSVDMEDFHKIESGEATPEQIASTRPKVPSAR